MGLELLLLFIAGLADRIRGGYPEGRPKWVKYLAMLTIGPCLTAQITTDLWMLLGSTPLAFLTMWRQDNGWRGRWVQTAETGAYDTRNILKAARWGLIASLSFLPLVYWEPGLLWYLAAFPLGAIIAMAISIQLPPLKTLDLRHGWPWSELIELPIIGVIAWILNRFI